MQVSPLLFNFSKETYYLEMMGEIKQEIINISINETIFIFTDFFL